MGRASATSTTGGCSDLKAAVVVNNQQPAGASHPANLKKCQENSRHVKNIRLKNRCKNICFGSVCSACHGLKLW